MCFLVVSYNESLESTDSFIPNCFLIADAGPVPLWAFVKS